MKLPDPPFTPTGKKVLLQVVKVTETSQGLHIPDTVRSDSWETPRAWVVAAGPKCEQVKRGDLVYIGGSVVGIKIKIRGVREVDYMLVEDEDRIAGIAPNPEAN